MDDSFAAFGTLQLTVKENRLFGQGMNFEDGRSSPRFAVLALDFGANTQVCPYAAFEGAI